MPVYVEQSVLELDKIYLNGGRRNLIGIAPAADRALRCEGCHRARCEW